MSFLTNIEPLENYQYQYLYYFNSIGEVESFWKTQTSDGVTSDLAMPFEMDTAKQNDKMESLCAQLNTGVFEAEPVESGSCPSNSFSITENFQQEVAVLDSDLDLDKGKLVLELAASSSSTPKLPSTMEELQEIQDGVSSTTGTDNFSHEHLCGTGTSNTISRFSYGTNEMETAPASSSTSAFVAGNDGIVVYTPDGLVNLSWNGQIIGNNGPICFAYRGVNYVVSQGQPEVDSKSNPGYENDLSKARRIQCPHCKLSYVNASTLKNHIKAFHGSFECIHCDFLTESAKELARHGIFSHSTILIKKPDQVPEQLKNDGDEQMVFFCYWNGCNWKGETEKLITHHLMADHLGINVGYTIRKNLRTYEFPFKLNLESYTLWNWRKWTQKYFLPKSVSSSYDAISFVAHASVPIRNLVFPAKNMCFPKSGSTKTPETTDMSLSSNASQATAKFFPTKTPKGDQSMEKTEQATFYAGSEDHLENYPVVLEIENGKTNPVKTSPIILLPEPRSTLEPRRLFYCFYCDLKSDVARDVALHEVRFHCKRQGLPKTSTIFCNTCSWASNSEEYLVLHILFCHRSLPLNDFEKAELQKADKMALEFFGDRGLPIKKDQQTSIPFPTGFSRKNPFKKTLKKCKVNLSRGIRITSSPSTSLGIQRVEEDIKKMLSASGLKKRGSDSHFSSPNPKQYKYDPRDDKSASVNALEINNDVKKQDDDFVELSIETK